MLGNRKRYTAPDIMPRKGIICNMCGGEFFERSFPIHQKACAAKQQHIRLECQHCHQEVPKLELEKHLSRCPKAPMPKIQPQTQGHTSSGPISNVFDEYNRLQCAVCGRWFTADRVAKHQGICSTISQKKRPVFDSFRQRRFNPQIHRAAPVAARLSSSTSAADHSRNIAAARSYYYFAPHSDVQRIEPKSSSLPKGHQRDTPIRGTTTTRRGKSSGSQLPLPSSRRSSHLTQSSNEFRFPRATKSGGSLCPPSPSASPASRPRKASVSSPPASPERASGSSVKGSSRQPSPHQVNRPKYNSRGGSPTTAFKTPSPRQSYSTSRAAGRSRNAPASRLGRQSPFASGGGGGISTSNVSSPDNPFAYPHYPS